VEIIFSIVKDIGFPIFVAVFVLCRLEPAVRRLERSISALTLITAKSNGVSKEAVDDAIKTSNRRSALRFTKELIEELRRDRGGCDV